MAWGLKKVPLLSKGVSTDTVIKGSIMQEGCETKQVCIEHPLESNFLSKNQEGKIAR